MEKTAVFRNSRRIENLRVVLEADRISLVEWFVNKT
jgi:hypothetical protein